MLDLEPIKARMEETPWDESWKAISMTNGEYEVSDQGKVRSYLKKGNHRKKHAGYPRILKQRDNGRGYMYVSLPNKIGKYTNRAVHRLVLEAFIGLCPEGCEAAHLNGDPSDNRLVNLIYCSHKENETHKIKHGTSPRGENNSNARFLGWQIAEMKFLAEKGIPQHKIASLFDASRQTISEILNARNWSHIKPRTDIPALVAEIEELRGLLKEALGVLVEDVREEFVRMRKVVSDHS